MPDLPQISFEFGKIVLAPNRDVTQLIRALDHPDQEKIILQKIGKYWNQENRLDRPEGLVVVTNYRLLFLTRIKVITTTTDYLSFPLEMIEGLEATRVWLITPAIRFRVQGREYTFTFFGNAAEVVQAVQSSRQVASRSGNEK
jgi:hypothetical protein